MSYNFGHFFIANPPMSAHQQTGTFPFSFDQAIPNHYYTYYNYYNMARISIRNMFIILEILVLFQDLVLVSLLLLLFYSLEPKVANVCSNKDLVL